MRILDRMPPRHAGGSVILGLLLAWLAWPISAAAGAIGSATVADWLRSPAGQLAEQRMLEYLDTSLRRRTPLLFDETHRFDIAAATCSKPGPDEPQVHQVIAAPKYSHPWLRHIIGPANDAQLMIATLERRGITRNTIHAFVGEVARPQVIAAMEEVLACLKRHDQVVFYFSGHAEIFDDERYRSGVRTHLSQHLDELGKDLCDAFLKEQGDALSVRERLRNDCGAWVKGNLVQHLLAAHLKSAGAVDARASLGTVLEFSDGPFRKEEQQWGMMLAGMRARDLSEFVTAGRNRGADVLVVIDTHHAGGLEVGARQALAQGRWISRTQPGSGHLVASAERAAKLKFNTGDYAAFYVSGAAGDAWEMVPEGQPDGRKLTYGPLTYALAQALQSDERPTVRQLAESISRRIVQKDLIGLMGDAANHSENLPVYEASNPDLMFLSPKRPLATGEDIIEILEPKQTRGAIDVSASVPQLDVIGRVKDRRREDVVMVEVDGANVLPTLNQNLQFRSTVNVQPGKNQIRISVLTRDLVFSRRDFAVNFEGELESLVSEGQRYALVIGNQKYDRARGFEPLPTPHADARGVAEALQRRHGFTTELPLGGGRSFNLLLLDAKGRDIDEALALLGQRLTPKDTLVIYYAGHGIYDDKFGLAAWVPTDAQAGLPTTLYDGRYLQGHIKGMAANKVIVLSDSCYAGRLLRDAPSEAPGSEDRRLALVKAMGKKSRVFIAAGGNEPVLDGGGSGHSVFTRALLDGLERMAEEHTVFSARELFDRHIYPRVHGRERQEPRYSPLDDSGHVGGDFLFARK